MDSIQLTHDTALWDVGDYINFAIAVVTAAAAFFAYRAVIVSRLTLRGQLYVNFQEEYDKHEMSEALKTLNKHFGKISEGERKLRIENWTVDRASSSDKKEFAMEIDKARRKVKFYFWKAYRLNKFKYVDDNFVISVGDTLGLVTLIEIVKPLDIAIRGTLSVPEFQSKLSQKMTKYIHNDDDKMFDFYENKFREILNLRLS